MDQQNLTREGGNNMNLTLEELILLKKYRVFKWGKPADIWTRNVDIIERMVKEGLATKINDQYLPSVGEAVETPVTREAEKGAKSAVIKKIPFPGGLRFDNVHFKGDVYRVGEEGWKVFTARVIGDFTQKLQKAAETNTVSFDQMMEISDTLDVLG